MKGRSRTDAGYAMAALLVGLAVMSVLLAMAMPVWRTMVKREKEEELIFRGRQYARAIELYQRKYANTYPPSVDVLLEQKFLRRRYKDPMTEDGGFQVLYQNALPAGAGARGGAAGRIDPARRPGASPEAAPGARPGGLLPGGTGGTPLDQPGGLGAPGGSTAGPRGGIVGVVSKSTESSLRVYDGRTTYNEWQFVYAPAVVPGSGTGEGRGPRGPGAARPGMTPGAGRGPGGARGGPAGPVRPPG